MNSSPITKSLNIKQPLSSFFKSKQGQTLLEILHKEWHFTRQTVLTSESPTCSAMEHMLYTHTIYLGALLHTGNITSTHIGTHTNILILSQCHACYLDRRWPFIRTADSTYRFIMNLLSLITILCLPLTISSFLISCSLPLLPSIY